MINSDKITEKSSSKYLLFGGFGNQLFQLAKGISEQSGRRVNLVRFLKHGQNDLDLSLDSFTLPPSVQIMPIEAPRMLIQKTINLGLRLSASYRITRSIIPLRIWTISLISLVIRLFIRQKVVFNLGVGLDQSKNRNSGEISIGYFQYQPEAETLAKLTSLELREPSNNFLTMLHESRKVKFAAVHIRLGDYFSDSKIGVLTPDYFEAGLQLLLEAEEFDAVYVFSNDINKAKEVISSEIRATLFFVGENVLEPPEAFELMRNASGYVISNSTFSWWAAMLSHSSNPKVVCPNPWFQSLPEPLGLIPSGWLRLQSKFQQGSHGYTTMSR